MRPFPGEIEGEKLRDFRDLLEAATSPDDKRTNPTKTSCWRTTGRHRCAVAKGEGSGPFLAHATEEHAQCDGRQASVPPSSGAPSSAVRLMTRWRPVWAVGRRSSNSGDLWTEPHLIQRVKKKTRNGHLEQPLSNKHGKMLPPPKAAYGGDRHSYGLREAALHTASMVTGVENACA